jgi:hypothetical protein
MPARSLSKEPKAKSSSSGNRTDHLKQENESARIEPRSEGWNPEIQKESRKKLLEVQNPCKKGKSFRKKQKKEVKS